jgi:hypothetical protein
MDPRGGPDDVEKRQILPLPALELRPLGRPTSSQSLYRLRYPGSWINIYLSEEFFKRMLERKIKHIFYSRCTFSIGLTVFETVKHK